MENDFTITPLTQARICEAAALEQLCFSSPWSAEQLAESVSMPGTLFLSALFGDELIGYIGFYRVLDEGFVTNLAVHPAHRRKGAGRALIRRLVSECSALGVRLITLEVRESNKSTLALYLSEGFAVDGRRPGFYTRPAEDALLLSRRV